MKKIFLSVLLMSILLFGLASIAHAESLTHFTGKVGFSVDYPADVLDVNAFGINTTFVTLDENDTMSLTILPKDELLEDPAAALLDYAKEYGEDRSAEDVREMTAASGAKIWSISFPSLNYTIISYIVQDGGRQFEFDAFMDDESKDKYTGIVDDIVLSFVNEPEGDMSGYEEEDSIEWEPDYGDTLEEKYREAIRQYALAVAEGWDAEKLSESGMSILPALMGIEANELGISFISMNENLPDQMILYCANADDDIEVIALATADEDGEVRFLVNGGERDTYVLCGNAQDGYTLAEYGSNSAFQSSVFFWKLNDQNELELVDGVLYDYEVNEQNPCFLVKDADWDATKGTPCTQAEADAVVAGYVPAEDIEEFFTLRDYIEFELGYGETDSE